VSVVKIVKFGEACSLDRIHNKAAALPYVGLEDIVGGEGRFIGGAEPKKVQSSTFKFTSQHILYGRLRPYLNKVYLPDFDGHCSTEIFPIRPAVNADRRYLYYWLSMETTVKEIDRTSTGARMPRANVDAILDFPIPLPSLPEQQRIVTILDEAFAGLATATTNTEKNLKNARELFESYLLSIFINPDNEWEESSLGELCALFVDSAHRTPKYQPEGIPALRPRDVVNGKLSLGEAAKVSEQEYEIQSKRHRPEPGDIVYSRELSYGWAALLPETPRICLSQGMCLFRPKPEIDVSFLLYVLNGPIGRQQAVRAAVGTAHPHINLGEIKNYRIAFPQVAEQRKIVAQLDSLSSRIQRMADVYTDKLKMLSVLKQSILGRAFSGELTSPPSQAIKEAAE
jgi:type I restriction enzyme S subunit